MKRCYIGGLGFGVEGLGLRVLKVLVRRDHGEYASLKGDPNQMGNIQNFHVGDRCS